MGKDNNHLKHPRVVSGQALEVTSPGPSNGSTTTESGGRDVLLLHDVPGHLSYRAIHDLVKPFGNVCRIRLIYDDDLPTNRCYITFATAKEAESALQSVNTFNIPISAAELLSSANVEETEDDYVPNILERTAEETSSTIHSAPTPRWYVAYYRNGRGNFIRASRFLTEEFGSIPREDVRPYGKGVLIRAKDLTQAKMLLHSRCNPDCIFDSIRPHRTFNFCRGIVYNYDLYDFSEDEIYDMCPPTVQKVWKVKGKGNMIVLTFFGSCLPDYIQVGPLRLRVKPFLDRPLQCFNCYEFGHGRKHCTKSRRCGRCSALDAHSTDECNSTPYCFHCRADHHLRSRDCPQYRFEQDVLQLANANHISLGSARRELSHRLGASGTAASYASTLSSRPNNTRVSGSQVLPSSSSQSPASPVFSVRNKFSALSEPTSEVPPFPAGQQSTDAGPHTSHDDSTPRSPRRKGSRMLANKRHHGSTDSIELSSVPPTKFSASSSPPTRSAAGASTNPQAGPVRSSERSSSLGRLVPPTPTVADTKPSDDVQLMGGEKSLDLESFKSPASITSVARDNAQADSLPLETSVSGAIPSTGSLSSRAKVSSRPGTVTIRTGTSRILTPPGAGPSGSQGSRRISLPNVVGKGKQKPLPGARPS